MASSVTILSDDEDGQRPNKKFKLTNIDIGSQGNFPLDLNIPSDSIILCLEKLPDNDCEVETIYDSSDEPEIKIELNENETNITPDPLNINSPDKSTGLPQEKIITPNVDTAKSVKTGSQKPLILRKNLKLKSNPTLKNIPVQMINKKVPDNSDTPKTSFSSPMHIANKAELNSPRILRKTVDLTQPALKPYKPNTTFFIPNSNISTLKQYQSPATTSLTKPLKQVIVVNNKSAITSPQVAKPKHMLIPRLTLNTMTQDGSISGKSSAAYNRVNKTSVSSITTINPKQGGVLKEILTDTSISQDVCIEPNSPNLGKSTDSVSSEITVDPKLGGVLEEIISQDVCIEQNSSNLEKSTVACSSGNQIVVNSKLSSGGILKEILTDTTLSQDIDIEQNSTDIENSITTYTIVDKSLVDNNVNIESDGTNMCVVNGCEGSVSYYFKVPEDDKKFRMWKYCLKNQRIKIGDLVCEQHFIPEDIISKPMDQPIGTLKDHAMPSLKRVEKGCCIPQCLNQDKNAPNMYCIPIWGHFTPWINCMGELAVKIKNVHDLLQYRVCELHFPKDQLKNIFAMVPTLFLPSKNFYEAQLQSYLKNREPGLKKSNDFFSTPTTKNQPMTHPTTKIFSNSKELVESYCAYEGCNLDKKYIHVKFYKFPEHYATALLWLEACRRTDILYRTMTVIQKFIQNSIGVCFIHKNVVDRYILNKQPQTSEVAKSSNKVPEVETVVDLTANDEPNTLNESREPNQDSENAPEESYVPTREYCAFINCSTQIKDLVKKYRFPADPELLAHWIKAAGIPQTLPEDHLRSLFVCGKHFNENQYNEAGTLMLSAVPAPHIDYVDISSHDGNEHWVLKQKKTLVPTVLVPTVSKRTKAVGLPTTTTIDLLSDDEPLPDVICTQPSSVTEFFYPATGNPLLTTENPLLAQKKSVSAAEVFLDPRCIVKHCSSKKPDDKLYPFTPWNTAPAKHQLWIKAVTDSPAAVTSKFYWNKMICHKHFEKKYIQEDNSLTADAVPTLDLVEQETQDSAEKDISISWSECVVESTEAGDINDASSHVRGKAVLRENGIVFPNIGKELRFGKDCPKMGVNRFPFKLRRMRKPIKGQLESVNAGHRVQIHTAIVVDDDDESEKEAIELITKVLLRNSQVIPKRPSRRKTEKRKSLDVVLTVK